jgi:hypothetical protein
VIPAYHVRQLTGLNLVIVHHVHVTRLHLREPSLEIIVVGWLTNYGPLLVLLLRRLCYLVVLLLRGFASIAS